MNTDPNLTMRGRALAVASDESGATTVEYGFILFLIAVGCVSVIATIGLTAASFFGHPLFP